MSENESTHGGKRAGAGRKKGTANKVSKKTRQDLLTAIDSTIQEIPTLMQQISDPATKLNILTKLLTFVCPRPEPEKDDQPDNKPASASDIAAELYKLMQGKQ